jgi:hypothetical protein
MRRNARLLGDRPLDRAWRPLASFTAIERRATAVAILIGAALFVAAAFADHRDSLRRTANVQAALAARGLGAADVERVWGRAYRCRHAYRWRTASARGSACTDSFSADVEVYGPDRSRHRP